MSSFTMKIAFGVFAPAEAFCTAGAMFLTLNRSSFVKVVDISDTHDGVHLLT
jgi:hypothetical protein